MIMSDRPDPMTMLGQADQAQQQMRRRGRWYPAWVAAYGVVSAGIVAWMPVTHGWWAVPFTVVLVVWILGLQRWKARQTVRPAADKQILARWLVPWMVLYLIAVTWIGPRWLGQHVGWWAVMGIVVSLPAFLEALGCWRVLRS
jgi:hypothetical protein